MLFRYDNKVYIRPFVNRLVEVEVSKKTNDYDVKPTKNEIKITPEVSEKLYSISIEEAYNMQNKPSKERRILKDDKMFD